MARAVHGGNTRLPVRHVVLAVRGETAGVAEVVAALAVAQRQDPRAPTEESVLTRLRGAELARRAALDGAAQADICHPRLMRLRGVRGDLAALLGDDITVRARGDRTGPARTGGPLAFLAAHGADTSRLRMLGGPAAGTHGGGSSQAGAVAPGLPVPSSTPSS